MDSWADWVLFFVAYSFVGWLLESVYASIINKAFVNRGFIKGCFCPIYGFGAILIVQLSALVEGLGDGDVWTKVVFWCAATLSVTFLEYVTGWALESLFKRKWWDYSDNTGNLDGYICVKYSMLWGIMALLLTEFVHPFLETLIDRVPSPMDSLAIWLITGYFITDAAVSLRSALHGRGPLPFSKEDILKLDEYEECVRDLLDNDQVLSMEQFVHHNRTNRLHHSIQVSYISFKLCKWLSFDYHSAARGALLHDLFLYDWREHQPTNGLHAFSHPRTALMNAERHFSLNKVERDIILKHMWPLTPAFPRYKETFIVLLADKYCTIKEYCSGLSVIYRQSR